jgi:putative transposase
MARLPRLSVAGYPHHVIQRGNDRGAIFGDAEDYRRYLESLREITKAAGVAVHAYVLMPNHVHLLMTPHDAIAVGRTMQSIGRRYVRWFNDRHSRTGALFEGRYRSTVVEADRYLLACMRYIELNPVRAGIVQSSDQFPWSSYRHHAGLTSDPAITDHALYWSLGNTPFERQAAYMRLFDQDPGAAELDRIRAATHGGWALGERGFAAEIGRKSARRLVRRRSGRPPKAKPHSVPN